MQWTVPLFDPDLGQDEIDLVTEVLRSKWLTMGEKTERFEQAFARMVGVPHASAVSNCTAGLHLALAAAGVRADDDVVVPALTFVATANAVRYCGARPVFADVTSLDDWNICVRTIEQVVTPATKAIVVVHYAGYVADMRAIMDFARDRGLAVIEDVAHAPGATRDRTAAGAWGDVGCFSFFSNKNMTTGEGGMLTTSREDVAQRAKCMRSHGMTTLTLDRHKGHAFSYDVVDLGYNYRMSELNAALGLCQLERLHERNVARGRLVARYRERLASIAGVDVPFADAPGTPAFHIMPVLLPRGTDRQSIMARMRDCGIQTSIHYRPVDTFSAYVDAGLGPGQHLALTHDIGNREMTLPLYPTMTEMQVQQVCDALAAALSA